MIATLQLHILAGGLAILSGFIALYAAKGAGAHRRAGLLFACTMIIMCFSGFVITAARGVTPTINIPAALLTAYLVVTALATIRPVASRPLDYGAMLVALGVGLYSLGSGFEVLAAGGSRDGIPAFPYFMFGVVGLLAGLGDLRMIRRGKPQGAARLTRHLWRMCFALFIAVMSLFLGQADEFPEWLRATGLLNLPIAAVLLTMLYWLWRVRIRPLSHRLAHPSRVAGYGQQ